MFCAISGEIPEEPVVSVKSGHVFEKRLIEKHLQTHQGRCPVTDQPLETSDLVALKVNKVVKPRPTTATSIPAMLQAFQNEWDAVMLETYTLKKQLDSVRQELAQALYQHDAACRVIAKLMKERDEARQALANYVPDQPQKKQSKTQSDAMEVESGGGLSAELKDQVTKRASQLAGQRKGRAVPENLATPEDVAKYTVLSSHSYHKVHTGVHSIDTHPSRKEIIVSGGSDTNVIVYNLETKKNLASISEHKAPISKVLWRDNRTVITAAEDGTGRAVRAKDDGLGSWESFYNIQHNGPVSLSLHPLEDYIFSAASKNIVLHNLASASVVSTGTITSDTTSVLAHPDGMILGLGASDSTCKIWDIKAWKVVAAVEGHKAPVTSLAFSENGYYMATLAEDSVKLWDLRKLKSFHTIDLASDFTPKTVEFDNSGQYLAVAGANIQVFHGAKFTPVHTFSTHKDTVCAFKWGALADTFISGSLDRSVKLWGQK